MTATNAYHFEDYWDVPFPIHDVWEVLSHPRQFPLWWKDVYLSAELLDTSPEQTVGSRIAVVARGRLPYKLRFTIETTQLSRPHLIGFKTFRDFKTSDSKWILTRTGQRHARSAGLESCC